MHLSPPFLKSLSHLWKDILIWCYCNLQWMSIQRNAVCYSSRCGRGEYRVFPTTRFKGRSRHEAARGRLVSKLFPAGIQQLWVGSAGHSNRYSNKAVFALSCFHRLYSWRYWQPCEKHLTFYVSVGFLWNRQGHPFSDGLSFFRHFYIRIHQLLREKSRSNIIETS